MKTHDDFPRAMLDGWLAEVGLRLPTIRPNDFNAGSSNAAKRAAYADSPSAEPASFSATPPAAIAQDAQQGLAGGLSLSCQEFVS